MQRGAVPGVYIKRRYQNLQCLSALQGEDFPGKRFLWGSLHKNIKTNSYSRTVPGGAVPGYCQEIPDFRLNPKEYHP